jgi:hypothetical protein
MDQPGRAALTPTLSRFAGEGEHAAGTRDAIRLIEGIVYPLPRQRGRVRVRVAAGNPDYPMVSPRNSRSVKNSSEQVHWIRSRIFSLGSTLPTATGSVWARRAATSRSPHIR